MMTKKNRRPVCNYNSVDRRMNYKQEIECGNDEEDDDVFVAKTVLPTTTVPIESIERKSAGEKKTEQKLEDEGKKPQQQQQRVKKSLLSRFSFRGRKGKKVTSPKDFLASVGMEMALLVGIISNEERNLSDIIEESDSNNTEVNIEQQQQQQQQQPVETAKQVEEKQPNLPSVSSFQQNYPELSLINRRRLSRDKINAANVKLFAITTKSFILQK